MPRARWVGRWMMAGGAAAVLAAGHVYGQPPKTSPTGSAPSPTQSDGKQGKDPDVPAAFRPPPGMCRVWLAGVPPNQQPAPTDCASAVRNRPSNGRVLFGDDYVARKSGSTARFGPNTLTSVAGGGLSAWHASPALNTTYSAANAAETTAEFAAEPVYVGPHGAGRAVDGSQDDYEAGYAAGYRDAMNGRRPRFRGADRTDPGTGTTGYTPGGYGPAAYGQPGGGAVVVVPPGQDPRYFNNGQYPPPGRANGVCLDRDGDGWCDDPRFGAPVCRDLDGDGRCDDYPNLAAAPFPSSLPEMRAGVDVQQGRGSTAALRWLGTSEVVARLVNPNRGGTPYRVLWFDANTNTLLQSWTDLDGDGVADRVEIFRNGRRVKLLGR